MADQAFHTDITSTGNDASIVSFEKRLRADWEWGMSEASIFFEGKGRVQETLRRIARRLNELEIPYAVAGGMALYHHGHARFTQDVDILVTREGLKQIHEQLDGRGFVRPFEASKNLRDADTGVRVEFLLTGDFPGDGKPKDVAFPDPDKVAEYANGVKFVNLPTFITLKLASGMTGVDRDKYISDVVELIKSVGLRANIAPQLHPYVRSKFIEICDRVRPPTRFVSLGKSIGPEQLEAMLHDGVIREPDGRLVTTDPAVAQKHKMWPEDEVFEG